MGNPLFPDNSARYAKKVGDTEIAKNILSSTVPGRRIMRPMTRARTASYGVVTPPPLQLWLHAVLMLCVSLVQGAATTLGMIFNRTHRDWHTVDADENLPQATSGIHLQESSHTHGVILGLVPRIPVGSSRGLATIPHEAINQDARLKAGHDSVDVARAEAISLLVIPDTRAACGPEPRAACANVRTRISCIPAFAGMTP